MWLLDFFRNIRINAYELNNLENYINLLSSSLSTTITIDEPPYDVQNSYATVVRSFEKKNKNPRIADVMN